MRKRSMIKIFSLVVGVSLLGLGIIFMQEGFARASPALRLRRAQQEWESGQTGEAAQTLVEAFRMALEAGSRYAVARPFIDQMHTLMAEQRMNEAYDQCVCAVGILDGWDEGGMISYECFWLEVRTKCIEAGDQIECPP